MDQITAIIAILTGFLTIFGAIQLIKQRNLDNEQKKLTIKIAQNELDKIESEKKAKELEIIRDENLDKKLEKQVLFLRKEMEGVYSHLDEILLKLEDLNKEIKLTNVRIDESNKIRDEHINESKPITEFKTNFWFKLNNALHFWHPEDANFKLILENWGRAMEQYGIDYINSKIKGCSVITLNGTPESRMIRLIAGFYSSANNLVSGVVSGSTFGKWLKEQKLHAKSEYIALLLKKNGFKDLSEFNKLMTEYVEEFSTLYTEIADDWIKLSKIKYAS